MEKERKDTVERWHRNKTELLSAIRETKTVLLKAEIEKLHQDIKKLQKANDKLQEQTKKETNTARDELKNVVGQITKNGDENLGKLLIQKGELLEQSVTLLEQKGTMSEYGNLLSTWTVQLLEGLRQIVAPNAASPPLEPSLEESTEYTERLSPRGSCS